MTFTTQILVVVLYDTTNEKHYRDLGSERHKYGISTFCGATSGGVAKCQLFSHVQAGGNCRLRKHPFLLALRRWGRFARNVHGYEERGETDVFAG